MTASPRRIAATLLLAPALAATVALPGALMAKPIHHLRHHPISGGAAKDPATTIAGMHSNGVTHEANRVSLPG